jgi:hypothetical protein
VHWDAIWQYVIGGAIVSWPGVIIGFWINWRKTRQHVDQRTEEQNKLIEQLTEQQTSELLRSRARQARPPYHGHGDPAGS